MISSALALWWLALPVLLLPVWWHRQKRQRVKSEPLATARFLPAAPPQTARIWRWEDLVLLALRCLLLAALIAWLAATTMPWRGDTVFISPALGARTGAEAPAWIKQQIAAAGLVGAQQMPLPPDALQWLQANESEWRPGARMLVLAESIPMPAQLPPLAHSVDIRLLPAAAPSPAVALATPTAAMPRAQHSVVVAAPPEHLAAWRAMFAAFESADGSRYLIEDNPSAETELIVWDSPAVPPSGWRAPLWWLPRSGGLAAFGATEAASQPLAINGLQLQTASSPQGRLWISAAMPPQTADAARALYETWQSLTRPVQPYPMPAMQLAPRRNSPLAMPGTPPATWLAYLLLALFVLERLMTHVRRR